MYSGYVQNTLINFKVIVQNANVILDCNIIWTLLTAQNNHDSTPQFFLLLYAKSINQSSKAPHTTALSIERQS
jgi:hypothetical protein